MAEKKKILRPNPDDTPRFGVNQPKTEQSQVESGISSDMINPDGSFMHKIPAKFDRKGPRVNVVKELAVTQRVEQILNVTAPKVVNNSRSNHVVIE